MHTFLTHGLFTLHCTTWPALPLPREAVPAQVGTYQRSTPPPTNARTKCLGECKVHHTSSPMRLSAPCLSLSSIRAAINASASTGKPRHRASMSAQQPEDRQRRRTTDREFMFSASSTDCVHVQSLPNARSAALAICFVAHMAVDKQSLARSSNV